MFAINASTKEVASKGFSKWPRSVDLVFAESAVQYRLRIRLYHDARRGEEYLD